MHLSSQTKKSQSPLQLELDAMQFFSIVSFRPPKRQSQNQRQIQSQSNIEDTEMHMLSCKECLRICELAAGSVSFLFQCQNKSIVDALPSDCESMIRLGWMKSLLHQHGLSDRWICYQTIMISSVDEVRSCR